MLETYHTGGDIHAATTSVIFTISKDEALDKTHPDYQERRTIAKNVNFGTLYGLYPKGLMKTLNLKAVCDGVTAEKEWRSTTYYWKGVSLLN